MAGGKHVVLDLQVVEQEFDGEIAIRLDAADLGCRQQHRVGTFVGEVPIDGRRIGKVELGAQAHQQLRRGILFDIAAGARNQRGRNVRR